MFVCCPVKLSVFTYKKKKALPIQPLLNDCWRPEQHLGLGKVAKACSEICYDVKLMEIVERAGGGRKEDAEN